MNEEREPFYIDSHCEHCESQYDLENASCDYTAGDSLHCSDHRDRCAICKHVFCLEALIENEVGELLCDECHVIEAVPVVIAARRTARTGSYKDLKEYLRLRKAME